VKVCEERKGERETGDRAHLSRRKRERSSLDQKGSDQIRSSHIQSFRERCSWGTTREEERAEGERARKSVYSDVHDNEADDGHLAGKQVFLCVFQHCF